METDEQFMERLMKGWARHDEVWAGDAPRLFALARRGAEAAARIEQLEAALRVWSDAYKTGRNEPLVIAYESTRAALEEKE